MCEGLASAPIGKTKRGLPFIHLEPPFELHLEMTERQLFSPERLLIHPRDQDYEDLTLSVIGLNKTLKHKQKVDPSAIQNFNIRSF